MTTSLKVAPKVALVTGASRGIGATIAETLAARGHPVVINYASRAADAEAVVGRIADAGGRAIAVKGDVADPAAIRALFEAAEATFGGADILVANAGIMDGALPKLADTTDEGFARLLDINVKGVFYALREAAHRLRAGGRIITLSSSVIGLRLPGYGAYAATKSAVETMSVFLSQELRGRQITVNTVAPGPVATELFFTGKSEARVAQLAKLSPLERLGQPQDIAEVIAFLASAAGGWVNGQVLRANGGVV